MPKSPPPSNMVNRNGSNLVNRSTPVGVFKGANVFEHPLLFDSVFHFSRPDFKNPLKLIYTTSTQSPPISVSVSIRGVLFSEFAALQVFCWCSFLVVHICCFVFVSSSQMCTHLLLVQLALNLIAWVSSGSG